MRGDSRTTMKNGAILMAVLSMAATGAWAQQKQADETIMDGPAKVRAEIRFAPVLHIELGSGATARDILKMEARSARDYREGKTARVHRQLKLFSIGTGYAVDAKVSAPHSAEDLGDLGDVFALCLVPPGEDFDYDNFHKIRLSPHMKGLCTGGPDGERELDAAYRIKQIAQYNTQAFNKLAAKDGGAKTYVIDVCYVIVPD